MPSGEIPWNVSYGSNTNPAYRGLNTWNNPNVYGGAPPTNGMVVPIGKPLIGSDGMPLANPMVIAALQTGNAQYLSSEYMGDYMPEHIHTLPDSFPVKGKVQQQIFLGLTQDTEFGLLGYLGPHNFFDGAPVIEVFQKIYNQHRAQATTELIAPQTVTSQQRHFKATLGMYRMGWRTTNTYQRFGGPMANLDWVMGWRQVARAFDCAALINAYTCLITSIDPMALASFEAQMNMDKDRLSHPSEVYKAYNEQSNPLAYVDQLWRSLDQLQNRAAIKGTRYSVLLVPPGSTTWLRTCEDLTKYSETGPLGVAMRRGSMDCMTFFSESRNLAIIEVNPFTVETGQALYRPLRHLQTEGEFYFMRDKDVSVHTPTTSAYQTELRDISIVDFKANNWAVIGFREGLFKSGLFVRNNKGGIGKGVFFDAYFGGFANLHDFVTRTMSSGDRDKYIQHLKEISTNAATDLQRQGVAELAQLIVNPVGRAAGHQFVVQSLLDDQTLSKAEKDGILSIRNAGDHYPDINKEQPGLFAATMIASGVNSPDASHFPAYREYFKTINIFLEAYAGSVDEERTQLQGARNAVLRYLQALSEWAGVAARDNDDSIRNSLKRVNDALDRIAEDASGVAGTIDAATLAVRDAAGTSFKSREAALPKSSDPHHLLADIKLGNASPAMVEHLFKFIDTCLEHNIRVPFLNFLVFRTHILQDWSAAILLERGPACMQFFEGFNDTSAAADGIHKTSGFNEDRYMGWVCFNPDKKYVWTNFLRHRYLDIGSRADVADLNLHKHRDKYKTGRHFVEGGQDVIMVPMYANENVHLEDTLPLTGTFTDWWIPRGANAQLRSQNSQGDHWFKMAPQLNKLLEFNRHLKKSTFDYENMVGGTTPVISARSRTNTEARRGIFTIAGLRSDGSVDKVAHQVMGASSSGTHFRPGTLDRICADMGQGSRQMMTFAPSPDISVHQIPVN